MISSHQSTLLSSLILLTTLVQPITAGDAAIARSPPPEPVHRCL
jgi:hypothetical protein